MNAPLPSQQVRNRTHDRLTEVHRVVKARGKRPLRSESPQPTTTDPAVAYWLDTFHHYHTDGSLYLPCMLKLVEVRGGESSGDAQPGRYACEVALSSDARGQRWMFIVWDIDVPSMRFCQCASQQEAMALYDRPDAVTVPTCGVRLRPDARPW